MIEQARKAGMRYIAITDHDTIDGLSELELSWLAGNRELQVIPGVEFSTDVLDHEVHILGYHFDIFHTELRRQLHMMVEARHERAEKMLKRLQELDYPIDIAEVSALAGNGVFGRPHIAMALVKRGYFSLPAEAFAALLNRQGPAYVPRCKLSPEQVLAVITQAGGVAVLAHPGLVGDDAVVEAVLQTGIQGLEVYHPKHTREQTSHYAALAEQYGLMVTGGSDFHGLPGRYPEALGMFTVPDILAQQLCARWGGIAPGQQA